VALRDEGMEVFRLPLPNLTVVAVLGALAAWRRP